MAPNPAGQNHQAGMEDVHSQPPRLESEDVRVGGEASAGLAPHPPTHLLPVEPCSLSPATSQAAFSLLFHALVVSHHIPAAHVGNVAQPIPV